MSDTTILCTDYTDIYTQPDLRIQNIIYADGTTYDLAEDPKNEQEELSLVALAHMHKDKKEKHKDHESILRYWKFLDALQHIHNTSLEAQLVTHRTQGENILLISGSPADVLHVTYMPSAEKFALQKNLESIMRKRNKVIAIARREQYESAIHKNSMNQFQWLGAFSIPLHMREGIDSIHQEIAQKNISSVKIFSSDNLYTCIAVAHAAGMRSSPDSCVTGLDIRSMSDAEVLSILPHTTIFSELNSLDEQRLIRLFESSGSNVLLKYGEYATNRS